MQKNSYNKIIEQSFEGDPMELPTVVPDFETPTWRDTQNQITIVVDSDEEGFAPAEDIPI